MRPLHRVLLVLAAFLAFQGVQACASEDPGLNPQPLPPEQKDDQARSPEEAVADPSKAAGGSTSSGGSTTSGGPNAGGDGDGGDAGGGDSGGDN